MIGEEVVVKEKTGILGVVSKQYQHEFVKAKVPEKLAWCFRMSDMVRADSEETDEMVSHKLLS